MWAFVLALVIILLWFWNTSEYMSITRDAQIYSDLMTAGGGYESYKTMAKIPLTPWQYARLMGLKRKNTLSVENISLIMKL